MLCRILRRSTLKSLYLLLLLWLRLRNNDDEDDDGNDKVQRRCDAMPISATNASHCSSMMIRMMRRTTNLISCMLLTDSGLGVDSFPNTLNNARSWRQFCSEYLAVLGNLERFDCASKKGETTHHSCRISSNDTSEQSKINHSSIFSIFTIIIKTLDKTITERYKYEEQQQNRHRTSMLLSSSSSLPFIGIICSVLSGDSRIKNCSSFIRIRYSFSVIPSKYIATDSSNNINIFIISIVHGIRSTIIRQHNKTE